MKKHVKILLSLVCLVALMLNLCACAQKSTTAAEVPAVEEAPTEQAAQMPNPMVEITDAEDFNTKLNIPIDSQYLPGEVTMYIIGDELAELTFDVSNIDGDPITCTLRAAKPGVITPELSGVYDDMTETTEEYTADESITVTHKTPASEPYEIYEFEYNGNAYCFMYTGTDMSAMLFGELLDGVFCAVGAETVPQ